MSAIRYTYNVYDSSGTFLDTLSNATVSSFQKRNAAGVGDFTIELTETAEGANVGGVIEIGNQIKVTRKDAFTTRTILGGWVRDYEIVEGSRPRVVLNCEGWVTKLDKNRLRFSTQRINTSITGTPGTLIQRIIHNYRCWLSDTMDSNLTGNSNAGTFGSTTWRATQFTSGSTSETSLITGADLKLKYNTGTPGSLTCAIYADDGSNRPTGAALVTAADGITLPTSWTTYQVMRFVFPTPLQLSTDTLYHIVIKSTAASATNTYIWQVHTSVPGYNQSSSTDSGSSWTAFTNEAFYFQALYADDSKVVLNPGTIDTAGTSISLNFKDISHFEAINQIQDAAPANYYWNVEPDGTVTYGDRSDSGQTKHTFTVGKDVLELSYRKTIEDKVNTFFMTDDTTTLRRVYNDSTDVSSNGEYWDSEHTDLAVADANIIGPDKVARLKDPKNELTLQVSGTKFDIFGIEVGDRARVQNTAVEGFAADGVIIQAISYDIDSNIASLEVDTVRPRMTDKIKAILAKADKLDKDTTPAQYQTF